MVTFPTYIKSHKKSTAIVAILLAALLVSNPITYVASQSGNVNESLGMKGNLMIKIDGKITYNQPDLIMYYFYEFNMCKLFNDTTACGGSGTSNGMSTFYHNNAFANGCRTYNTAGVIDKPNNFSPATRCSATAAFLSTDTDAPSATNPLLQTYLASSGFAPAHITTAYTITTNTITLTATWTATSSQNGIDKAAIALWNDANNAYVDSGSPFFASPVTVLTSDIFTAQTVNSGQSFQVIWTVSF